MKNLKGFEKFFENFPPGAANDPSAPYNQKSPSCDTDEFDGILYTEDQDEIPVHIKYSYYYEHPNSFRKQIVSYEYDIKGDASKLKQDYIDGDIRNLIVDNIGDHYYDWIN